MTVNQAVYTVLVGSTAVRAVLSTSPATSPASIMAFPNAVQSEIVPPYLLFRVTGDEDMRSLDGGLPSASAATVEFYCYGKTAAEAESVFDAVSDTIVPYRNATWWQGTIHQGVTADYIAELQLHVITFTAKIWHFNN